jgi:RimJ/RimL family protein N-acetyltransferase
MDDPECISGRGSWVIQLPFSIPLPRKKFNAEIYMFIQTERLFLRPLWREDADQIYPLINEWDVVSKLARAPWPYTLSDAHVFTDYAEAAAESGNELVLAICLRPSLQIIGCIGALRHRDGAREIGYWLGKSYWGHGFASEAAAALVSGLFESLRVGQLISGFHLDNPASARVLAKLGFQATHAAVEPCRAQSKDVPVQRMALTRSAWQADRVACSAVD